MTYTVLLSPTATEERLNGDCDQHPCTRSAIEHEVLQDLRAIGVIHLLPNAQCIVTTFITLSSPFCQRFATMPVKATFSHQQSNYVVYSTLILGVCFDLPNHLPFGRDWLCRPRSTSLVPGFSWDLLRRMPLRLAGFI